jgi:DNA invertase Pin-like site-specific DNA recombinase
MKIKYNRVSTNIQTGLRFDIDTNDYDLVLFDKISGKVSFRERPEGKKLVSLVEQGKVKELVVEDFSRVGRNTGEVISTLEWLDSKEVNVIIRNLGLESRPKGVKNPIWKMISSVLSTIYELELENIKERTTTGRLVYVQNGGVLGRPKGTEESLKDFMSKPKNKEIVEYLNRGLKYREIMKLTDSSTKTIVKVKKSLETLNLN